MFYHLGELDDSLNYALGSGSLFDVNVESEYVNTLVGECDTGSVLKSGPHDNSNYWTAARCLDRYFELRVKLVEQKQEVDIDPRLTSVVERMLDRYE